MSFFGIFEGGYYLLKDIVDKMIEFICDVKVIVFDKLWFSYVCLGVGYVLYYVFKEWVDRYVG